MYYDNVCKKFDNLLRKNDGNIAQVAKIPLIYLPVAFNDLIDNRLGREGPAFLKKPECEWANSTQTDEIDDTSLIELAKTPPNVT